MRLSCLRFLCGFAVVFAGSVCAQAQTAAFNSLVDRFYQAAMLYEPTQATAFGIHAYDSNLEDWSPATIRSEIQGITYFLKKFDAFPANSLDQSTQGDLEMMRNHLRSRLLDFQTIRMWQRNPDLYSSGITSSAFSLIERNFAPPEERMRNLIAREQQMPKVLAEAKGNLDNPPQIYTEIALEQIAGDVSFFQNDVPAAFTNVKSRLLQAEFARSNAAVIAALNDYAQWMKADLLPRSHGDFRFGADTFAKKLQYDEMVTTPAPELLAIAMSDLHRNQAEFKKVAARVDRTRRPSEVLAELAADHVAPDQLLEDFHAQFAGLTAFIRDRHIITIPSDVEPVLEETPPFMRATTQASMDPPGPFEAHSKTAYFNVTLPDKSWTPERTAAYMAAFNVGTVTSTAVHEAYPGHYVQFLWVNTAGLSKVRKLVTANTNVEGWAHYCEQMMLDAGYGQPGTGAKTTRDANLIRLGQLQDALLRDARFVVAIQMHTGDMSMAQATDFFVKQGYQSRPIAEVEVKRGTSDATYLYYTLGKLMIQKLKSDMMQKEGKSFSLQGFHDAFMKQGGAPLPIVRQALLGDNSPSL
ncbi:DUF885 domain-containing protein [Acidipila sp. EB88]|uniref:DUF885 domain-containing protein n=1 Tax=Acidipila sp. EB88 TaxID=2305226 RepID=UPI000F5DD66D|nr:DUF885 domain-containing protein [Acidipila sp. EB88]RRA48033.1 DUF885 domain-containing protein [Acidipila sp. EB88]